MHADDAVLYEGGQGQPVEEGVDALPSPQALLVAHALYALQPEPKQRVDVRRLHSMGTLTTMAPGVDIIFAQASCRQDALVQSHSRYSRCAETRCFCADLKAAIVAQLIWSG